AYLADGLGGGLPPADPEDPDRVPLLGRLVRGARRAESAARAGASDGDARPRPARRLAAPLRRSAPTSPRAARRSAPHLLLPRRLRARRAHAMSTPASPILDDRLSPAEAVAGFLAAAAIFVAAITVLNIHFT